MEDNSPYQASRVLPVTEPSRQHPGELSSNGITHPITQMWIAWVAAGLLAMGRALIPFFGLRSPAPELLLLIPLFVSVYLLLAYGIYKRSRIVATLALVAWSLSALGTLAKMVLGQPGIVSVALTAVLGIASVRGTLAIYRHHRFKVDSGQRPAPARERRTDHHL